MTQTVLILGASGRFGRNAAEQFAAEGWIVHRFDRTRDDLMRAARGADVIVNGWNPAYTDWEQQVPEQTAQIIAAARQSGATVIVPGNVYVFGSDVPAQWSETTPHLAKNPLGRVRIEMEAAYARSGVRTIVLRAGDFIDTQASGNWFDRIMIKSLARGIFTYPGDPDVPHAWAYLPDMARAVVQLANIRDDLPDFTDVSFPGYTMTGRQMAAGIDRLTPQTVRLKQMSWVPIQMARPFWKMGGKILEMRYLWNMPHLLDGAKFNDLLPAFQQTPIETALASAIPMGSVQHQIDPDQPVTAGQ